MRYEMFTQQGERAVNAAVQKRLAVVRERAAEGYALTEQRMGVLVREVSEEVYALGFREVYDTAVRESLYYAFEKAV